MQNRAKSLQSYGRQPSSLKIDVPKRKNYHLGSYREALGGPKWGQNELKRRPEILQKIDVFSGWVWDLIFHSSGCEMEPKLSENEARIVQKLVAEIEAFFQHFLA